MDRGVWVGEVRDSALWRDMLPLGDTGFLYSSPVNPVDTHIPPTWHPYIPQMYNDLIKSVPVFQCITFTIGKIISVK